MHRAHQNQTSQHLTNYRHRPRRITNFIHPQNVVTMTTSITCFGFSPCFGLIEPALTFGQFCWIVLAIGIGLFSCRFLCSGKRRKTQWVGTR